MTFMTAEKTGFVSNDVSGLLSKISKELPFETNILDTTTIMVIATSSTRVPVVMVHAAHLQTNCPNHDDETLLVVVSFHFDFLGVQLF